MKKYQYVFTKTTKTLLWVLLALCVLCVGYSAYRSVVYFLSVSGFDFYAILNRTLPFFVGIFGFVVSLSMLKNSCYEIAENQLVARFGVIVSRYSISDIEKLHLFQITKKLTVYFRDGRYMAAIIKEEEYRDFIEELQKKNKRIFYSEAEEEIPA